MSLMYVHVCLYVVKTNASFDSAPQSVMEENVAGHFRGSLEYTYRSLGTCLCDIKLLHQRIIIYSVALMYLKRRSLLN